MSTIFLIMYCPTIVGTPNECQETSGKKRSGPNVVNICIPNMIMVYFVSLGIRNRIPIEHSNTPRRNTNDSILIVPANVLA